MMFPADRRSNPAPGRMRGRDIRQDCSFISRARMVVFEEGDGGRGRLTGLVAFPKTMTHFNEFTPIPDSSAAPSAARSQSARWDLVTDVRAQASGGSVKYELTGERRTNFQGAILAKIRATRDIPSQNVSRGDLGGWVEGTSLPSSAPRLMDSAWVSGNAEVFGNARLCHNALVTDGARVSGNAVISGNAEISGHALVNNYSEVSGSADVRGVASISENAQVFDNAHISGHARIFGNARVYGNAQVTDVTRIGGSAEVHGDAHISGQAGISGRATVSGNARVEGHANVQGNTQISGNAHLSGDTENTNKLDD